MRRWLVAAALVTWLGVAVHGARAQASHAPATVLHPTRRPPPGIRRGLWAVPSWVVLGTGGGIALAAAAILAVRIRKKR